ncbi:CAP domain-containing protein [Plastorhodobacter daqingensis]|uniref:CAP domain-containing protein n=1 Tax=Plastorhodobacter daqingensis TaxID=1387281 RepID=A0ABW2UDC8_9RHOB
MFRLTGLFVVAALGLAACAGAPPTQLGADGRPVARVYDVGSMNTAEVQFRMVDAVNAYRQAGNRAPLQLNAQLNAAAATHARDMSVQNRPWHFGSDGSSPVDRVRRAGYPAALRGEAISETYESELETLAAWMSEPLTRNVIMDPQARDMGFAWFQEPSGKIWWTLTIGG